MNDDAFNDSDDLVPAAAGGLLDRRLFLKQSLTFGAGAGLAGFATGALADEPPWFSHRRWGDWRGLGAGRYGGFAGSAPAYGGNVGQWWWHGG